MRSFITTAAIMLSLFAFADAQSGRRVKPTPTPEVKVEESPGDFSESTPQPKRIFPPSLIRGDNSSKNDSKTSSPIAVPDGTPQVVNGDEVVKVDTDLVTIPVSVYDRNGLYIPNLRQNDFKIFEDGKEQPVAYFGTTDQPFTVILLIDTSPSTEYKIEEIQDAARTFIDKLEPRDTVMVIEFAFNVHVLAEPTTDRQVLYNAIRKSNFGDGTSLYDAVDFSLRKRLNQIQGRKAIVLFTDGVDTTSRKSNYDKTLALAEESDSLIFPVYYNTFFDNRRRQGSPMPPDIFYPPPIMAGGGGGSAADYALGKKYLDDLAAYTGGRVFRPESTPGGLSAAFEGIAEELRRQYSIGFIPVDEGKPGDRKQLKVRVARPNVVVRARDSYIVGSQTRAAQPAKTQ
jgi:Ca-activated chloride channel family protein